MNTADTLSSLKQIARQAGQAIMNIYTTADFEQIVDFKADNSPLTTADQASHDIIKDALSKLEPSLPLLSEEGRHADYATRNSWGPYWMVDPLDGTKEFIKKNGQFTVNIALIDHGKAVLGVVYAPAQETMYYGAKGEGAWMEKGGHGPKAIRVNNKRQDLVAVRSASHPSAEEEAVLQEFAVVDTISRGSSLKFCMVATGQADIYYRHGPTMEWDTAAGQAVVEAAGGLVLFAANRRPFAYTKEDLLNPGFLCLGRQAL